MASAGVNGVAGKSWATNKSASARSTAVAFYPRVTRGVIYISAGKAAVYRIQLSQEKPLWINVNDPNRGIIFMVKGVVNSQSQLDNMPRISERKEQDQG